MAKSYKVVFVDWDGTLSNSKFWDRWTGTDKYSRIQKALFVDGREYTHLWMKGLMTYSQVLTYVESKTGIPYKELADELEYSARNMEFIDNKAARLIHALRNKGVKVVIATDNMDTFRLWSVPGLALETLFDGILTSDTAGALKSESHDNGTSTFFFHYLAQNNIQPGESVLIDNSRDVKVVERFGIDFLHVNETTSLTQHLQDLLVNETTTAAPEILQNK